MTIKAETKTDKIRFLDVIKDYPFALFIFLIFIVLNITLFIGVLRPPLSLLALVGFAVFVFWYFDRLGGFTLFR